MGATSASAATAPKPGPAISIGATTLAKPAPGGRYVYVAANGTNKTANGTDRRYCIDSGWLVSKPAYCPAPDISHPLATVDYGVKVAQPGDVIVIRGGAYKGSAGYAARAGTASKPIVLQAAPKETVTFAGQFALKSADYWTITGIHFKYDKTHTTGKQVVAMYGGRNWKFIGNEISGTTGYANLMIRENDAKVGKGSTAERTAAAPQSYLVARNCIRDNIGKKAGEHNMYHDIYLQPTLYSKGGIVERNLLSGAPEGANLKVSGSTVTGSANDVIVRHNTMAYGATGIVTGLSSQNINSYGNAIIAQRGGVKTDAAMKTYDAAKSKNIVFNNNLVSGYAKTTIQSPKDRPMTVKNTTVKTVKTTGTGCSLRLADPAVAAKFGMQAAG
ncbi:chondroitinase-B domain-containing protein [Agromyces sp. NPDC057679]|uniref:chondroitinase-B domain-containing protein n=1 Tax=Agromyces sp. NPDC057679 TaxID=3346207 RepID=UPI00366B8720